MMQVPMNLREFDMKTIKDPCNLLWIGRRKTGKSFCIRDFLWHNQTVPVVLAMSGSEDSNGFYGKILPPCMLHPRFSEDTVKRILLRQKRVLQKKEVDPRMIFIMDDLMFQSREWIRSEEVQWISTNGRHRKITWILALQYVLGIPPAMRAQIDYVFMMKENIPQNRKRLFDAFGGIFGTLRHFEDVLKQVTENYGCLVIHNGSSSNRLEDVVFWYRAKDHNDFRLCAPVLWRARVRGGDDDERNEAGVVRVRKLDQLGHTVSGKQESPKRKPRESPRDDIYDVDLPDTRRRNSITSSSASSSTTLSSSAALAAAPRLALPAHSWGAECPLPPTSLPSFSDVLSLDRPTSFEQQQPAARLPSLQDLHKLRQTQEKQFRPVHGLAVSRISMPT